MQTRSKALKIEFDMWTGYEAMVKACLGFNMWTGYEAMVKACLGYKTPILWAARLSDNCIHLHQPYEN